MKHFLIFVCVMALLLSSLALGVSALSVDVDASVWQTLELRAFVIQTGESIMSDMNEDYWEMWWDDEVPELEAGYAQAATVNMRGFDMSADGRYMYCGNLNGGTGVRGVVVYDTATGLVTDLYEKYDGEAGLDGSPFSYAKGIAADDRGYVYVGFAFSLNYNVVNLGIAQQQEDGTLKELYYDAVYEFGAPGDQGGIKVGVNGVDVAKIGDKYYCYVMTNYEHDALYCYDVTDPENPVLDEDFGVDGVIDFSYDDCPVKGDGFTLNEGQYMDVDDDGVIWLVVNAKEGKDGIMRISPDGSECLGVVEQAGAYSVEHEGGFLLVGAKTAKTVTVLDDSSFETVATLTIPDGYGDRVTRIRVIDDILYICNACDDTNFVNTVWAAGLTGEAALALTAKAAALGAVAEDETETTQETVAEVATDAEAVTQADTVAASDDVVTEEDVTEADVQTEGASAAATEGATHAAAEESDGCASVMAVCAWLPVLAGASLVLLRKKED